MSFDTSMPNSSETSKLSANMKTIAEENLPFKKPRRRLIFCSEKMYFNSVKATRAPPRFMPKILQSIFFSFRCFYFTFEGPDWKCRWHWENRRVLSFRLIRVTNQLLIREHSSKALNALWASQILRLTASCVLIG